MLCRWRSCEITFLSKHPILNENFHLVSFFRNIITWSFNSRTKNRLLFSLLLNYSVANSSQVIGKLGMQSLQHKIELSYRVYTFCSDSNLYSGLMWAYAPELYVHKMVGFGRTEVDVKYNNLRTLNTPYAIPLFVPVLGSEHIILSVHEGYGDD